MHPSRRFLLQAASGCLLSGRGVFGTDFLVAPTPLFVREQRTLKRVLAATIADPERRSGSLAILAAGKETRVDLAKAQRSGERFLIPVDAMDQDVVYECVYRNGSRVRETLCYAAPEKHWQIFIVHNSHQDPGFAALPSKLRADFVRVLDKAADFCEKTRERSDETRFKWNIEVSYLLEDYRKARGEQAFQRVIGLINSGQMELGAFYCSIQTDPLSLEPLHRVVHYAAADVARQAGIKVQAAVLDDVPGLAWGLADVMARAGVRYLLFSGNPIRSNVSEDATPHLFYWQGPAGRRVLLFRSAIYVEGWDLISASRTKFDLSQPDLVAASLLERYNRGDYPYDAILLHSAHDFINPDLQLCDLVEAWNRAWEFPKFRLALLSEFFENVEGRYASRIPVYRGAYPDAWNDLRNTLAREEAIARQVEYALPEAEKWASLGHACGAMERDYSKELAGAYHHLLLFEEHTIGWDRGRHDIYVDESEGGGKQHHQEKAAQVDQARESADTARRTALSALSARIRPASARRVVVWNSLSWPRTGIVRVSAPQAEPPGLRDPDSGAYVACQKWGESEFAFVAAEVPSVGYRSYELAAGPESGQPTSVRFDALGFENRHYRVRFSQTTGGLTSLSDKARGIELVDGRARHHLNQLVYVLSRQLSGRRFQDLAELPATGVQVSKGASGPVFASMKSKGAIENILSFEHEVMVYEDLKRVDLVTRLRKKPVYPKEGLYLPFPFRVTPTSRFPRFQLPIKMDVAGGFMVPDAEQIPGSSYEYYIPQHGVFFADHEKSIFWTSLDAPIVEYGDIQSNRWLGKLAGDPVDLPKPWLYSYLMNNYWYTNTPLAQGGDFVFRYSITSGGPDWPYEEGKRFGWGALCEMTAIEAPTTSAGRWAGSGTLAEVTPSNVAICAIKRAEDGQGIIVRLAEIAKSGAKARLAVSIPGRRVRQAWVCDGAERNTGAAPVENGRITVRLAPFEVASIRVALEG